MGQDVHVVNLKEDWKNKVKRMFCPTFFKGMDFKLHAIFKAKHHHKFEIF